MADILIPEDCVLPLSTRLEPGVQIGRRVVLAGDNIVVRNGARLDAACVIGENVEY